MHQQNYPRRYGSHDHNIRMKNNIAVLYNRLKTTDTTSTSAKLYNKLHAEMRALPLQKLKQKLKEALKQEAFYDVEEFFSNPCCFK